MRRTTATAIVVLALCIMAGVPARTDAASPDQTRTDLSSLPQIEAYLASIGVDPGSVVVQEGRFNYAGPNCPGAGWNCTTANMVVQITSSTLPAANIFDCLPTIDASIPVLNECLIVQSSVLNPLETATTVNSASCDASTDDGSGRSKCTIRQQSKKGNNNAVIRQNIVQRVGSPQSATEIAEITQTSDSGSNSVRITQSIDQSLNIGTPADPTQQQQARQTAKVDQTSGPGNNSSDVQQTMLQVENAQSNANITQEQNQNTDASGPNQDAQITQTSTSGNNWSNLGGQLTQRQDAQCASCSVNQKQGALLGGQKGKVDQSTVTGTSNKGASSQVEDQRQNTNTTTPPTQVKIGPQDCCDTQIGGSDDSDTVTQLNIHVDNQTGGSSGTSDQNGHCSTAIGQVCTLDQTYTANTVTHHHGPETGNPVVHQRTCQEGAEANLCSDEFT